MSHLYPPCQHRPNASIDNTEPCLACEGNSRRPVLVVVQCPNGRTDVYYAGVASVDSGVIVLADGVLDHVTLRNGLSLPVMPSSPHETVDLYIWPESGSTMRRVVR